MLAPCSELLVDLLLEALEECLGRVLLLLLWVQVRVERGHHRLLQQMLMGRLVADPRAELLRVMVEQVAASAYLILLLVGHQRRLLVRVHLEPLERSEPVLVLPRERVGQPLVEPLAVGRLLEVRE